jgi:hypothetical protein
VLVVTQARLGRFFLEAGEPVVAGVPAPPPSAERLGAFAELAARYDQWMATPAENADVGVELPGVSGREAP